MSETPSLPPRDREYRVTWVSLLRTIRAPLAILILAGIALLVPPQTADMLAALGDGRRSLGDTFWFHVALAFLALSAWYWSRALLAARFDTPDNHAARNALGDRPTEPSPNGQPPKTSRREVRPQTYDLVPRLMFVLAVLIGLAMIIRSGAWSNLAYLVLWSTLLGFGVYYRTALTQRLFKCLGRERRAEPKQQSAGGMRKTEKMCDWLRNVPSRFWLLVKRAPWPNWISIVLVVLSLLVFLWGTLDAFLPWSMLWPEYPGLPALAAAMFPGPAVALAGLGLIIAPLSVLTFLFDGLDIEIDVLGLRLLKRPPVVTILVAWTLIAPALFSLHTVRIITPEASALAPSQRKDLKDLFTAWVGKCAPATGPVRPIIVAVSGGASRAAIWGERVLSEVENANIGPGAPRIFAVSSVSGGSLGVAAYMAVLATLDDDERCTEEDKPRKAQMHLLANHELSEDAVGPLLAGYLLVDIPRALVTPLPQIIRAITGGEPRGGDRAEGLERAFERLWRRSAAQEQAKSTKDGIKPPIDFSKPYLSLFYRYEKPPGAEKADVHIRAGMPIWIANGTDMATGSRLVTVPFDPSKTWPLAAATDVLAALGADVAISTAINNTARFPYLEPAGELLAYIPRDQQKLPPLDQRHQPDGTAREIIDGGYFDNEGLQTALDLADWLQREGPSLLDGNRTVEPIIVQATGDGDVLPIETVVRCEPRVDDPTEIAATRRPLQLLAPVLGLYNVRGGHAAVELRQARARYCADSTSPTYQCDMPHGLPVRCVTPAPEAARQRFFHFYLPGEGDKAVPLNWILSDSTARFIWDGAMKEGGNPRETWIMHEAFRPN
jgi:hypothetical protein